LSGDAAAGTVVAGSGTIGGNARGSIDGFVSGGGTSGIAGTAGGGTGGSWA
jgi:hypothetical protein